MMRSLTQTGDQSSQTAMTACDAILEESALTWAIASTAWISSLRGFPNGLYGMKNINVCYIIIKYKIHKA